MPQKGNHNHEITWSHERSNRLWEFYSTRLPENQYFGFHSGRYLLDYVERHVMIGSMRSILDFGCGPGYLIGRLIETCRSTIYGLDFSRGAVHKVVEKFSNNPRFGEAICVDRFPSSFKDDSMDLVISVEVVEHLDDEQLSEMLHEIQRLLRPGGYVVVTTPNNEDIEANKTICPECGCIFHRWQHVRTWNAHSLRTYFEKHGFKAVHVAETLLRPKAIFPEALVRWAVDKLRRLRSSFPAPPKPHIIYIGTK